MQADLITVGHSVEIKIIFDIHEHRVGAEAKLQVGALGREVIRVSRRQL